MKIEKLKRGQATDVVVSEVSCVNVLFVKLYGVICRWEVPELGGDGRCR